MGYITNHSFNLKFTLRTLGTPANPNFQFLWSRFSSDKEGVQYNSVGLYLQRSYSKTNAPGQVGAVPAAPRIVGSTTPTVETGWTTIKSWNAAETAALPDGNIVRYQDNSSQANPPTANQPLYSYRLIYYAEESGDNYEIDYRPAFATGGTGGTPGANQWALALGASGQAAFIVDTAVDSQGFVIVAGNFSGTVNFGGQSLTASGQKVFVARYTATGSLNWVVQVANSSQASCMALDSSDNIFLGGTFSGGMVVKLNPVGVLQWTHGPVLSGNNSLQFIQADCTSDGSVVFTGYDAVPQVGTPIDFGNGFTVTTPTLNSSPFIAKYSTAGVCLFARNFTTNGGAAKGTGIAVNRVDNSFFAFGYASSTVNIGGAVLVNGNQPGTFCYLGKFDSSGNHLWSRLVGAHGASDPTNSFSRAYRMALDGSANPVVAGVWNFVADFGGGARRLTGLYGILFVAKYRNSDGAYIWDYVQTASIYTEPSDIEVDTTANGTTNGTVAIAGRLQGNPNNFGNGIILSSHSTTDNDIFVAKLSASGTILWAKGGFGGTGEDNANAVTIVFPTGSVIAAGAIQSPSVAFGTTVVTNPGSVSAFMASFIG